MEFKDLIFIGESAREKLINGIRKISEAVSCTMGPGGRFVLLGQKGPTKDGVLLLSI